MKSVKKLYLAILVSIIVAVVTANDEPQPKRSNLLLRKPGGRNNIFTKTTTTTVQSIPAYEDELDEAQGDEEQLQEEGEIAEDEAIEQSAPTTTTEPAKKIGPIIRPFRSNDDLLNALKRRQQNMKTIKKVVPESAQGEESQERSAPVTAPKSVVAEKNGRKRFGGRSGGASQPQPQEQPESLQPTDESAQSVKRPGRSRFGLAKPAISS